MDVAVEEMIGDVREYDMKVFLAFLKVVYGPEFAPVREMIDRALLFDSEDLSTHAGDRGED